MGLVFERLDLVFLTGDLQNDGTYADSKTYKVKAIFESERYDDQKKIDSKEQTRNPDYPVDALCTIFFNKRIPVPEPQKAFLLREGKRYGIMKVNNVDIAQKLGLYDLELVEDKGKNYSNE